uniref:K+ potassium transporter integral membrane domain-containing protein n=1 Tax=Vitis vinifera TaxID=29760 RepID=F6I014_VITVI
MAIGDRILTPAISVLSTASSVQLKITELHENHIVLVSGVVLVVLFSLQRYGTHRVAFMFAPIVTAWLLCISGIGIYSILRWNPHVFCALYPTYMLKFLKSTGIEGWISLGGVVLSITEQTFNDPSHEENSVQSSHDIQVMKSGDEQLENSLPKEESLPILKARESGLAHILGHSHAKESLASLTVARTHQRR